MIKDCIGWLVLAAFAAIGIYCGFLERDMMLQALKPPALPIAAFSDCSIIRLEADGSRVCEAIRHIDWRPTAAFGQHGE